MATDVSFEDFRDEWLRDVQLGNSSSVELGRRFAHKLVTQWLEVDDASEDLVYCDGSGDGGIDVAYLDRDSDADDGGSAVAGHTWYLVQSKYGSAFAGEDTLFKEGRKVIETLDGQRERLSSLAAGVLERLNCFRQQTSERDRVALVFGTIDPLNEREKRALEDIRTLGRARLGPVFDVQAVSLQTIYQRVLEGGEAVAQLRLPISAKVMESGDDLLVGCVSLNDLFAFLKAYRAETGDLDQLYEKNVRQFLGGRRKVNKAMRETLESSPERFGLYNNGITLVVADFKADGSGCIELTEPFIVNGCQTTRTIWEVFYERLEAGGTGSDSAVEAWRRQAAQGVVVAKIVRVGVGGEAMLYNITKYTNSQNAVRDQDFIALNVDFRTWAQAMGDEYGVFLEIQRGGWDSRKAMQSQNPNAKQYQEMANAFDLLKVFGAGWLGEAGLAFGKNAPFLPGGSVFKRIMEQDGGRPFGVTDLYAAHRLNKAAQGYHFGRGAENPTRRQTRFFFLMVALDLLRDVMLRQPEPMDTSPRNVTGAVLRLFDAGQEEALQRLLDSAIEVIDEYLTRGTEDSVFDERAFRGRFNNDLNGFLKWEDFGKTEEDCPKFRSLLAATKRYMGRSVAGQQAARQVIADAIRV